MVAITSSNRNNEYQQPPPTIQRDGLRRMLPLILFGLCFLTTVYYTIYSLFQNSEYKIYGIVPPPGKAFCTEPSGCIRSDLFAFQICSFMIFIFCSGIGFYTWHISHRTHRIIPQTPAGRLFAYLPEAEYLAAINLTFQIWDFCISILIPENCTTIMMLHHIAAATVSFCSVRYTVLHYYGIFFLGCSEISSLFLVWIDFAKYFPPPSDTFYEHFIYKIAAPGFVLCFIYYRFVLWWPVSYQLFQDVYSVQQSGQANKLRPGESWILYIFLALNLPLGLLQLYWVGLIIDEIKNQIQGTA